MEANKKSSVDEEWETDSSKMELESVDEKAFKLLECGEEELYSMIQPRWSSTAKGVVDDLISLTEQEQREMERIEVELDCQYTADRTFVEKFMEDSNFMEAVGKLRKKNEKVLTSYLLFLDITFENRFRYLSSLRIWTKMRWKHLGMKTEREGLVKFFESEARRFSDSIPPIKYFESWVECIEEVRSLHKADVSVVVEKAQAKAADDMVVEKATAEGSNKPVVKLTELSEQT